MENKFNALTHVSPALTNERLSCGLSDWFGETTHFTHWEYVGETGKGDSYFSELIRIRIYGRTEHEELKNVQVILKNIPHSLSRRLTFRSDDFFKNEINFYEKVLPSLLRFQSEKQLKDPFTGYVKLFMSYSDGTNDFICLEDASFNDFGTAIRQEGIDIEHCKVTLKALAQFHAISFAMKDQKPQEFDELSSILFETYYHERTWAWHGRFWKRVCGIAIDAVEKEYPDSIYLQKVKEFAIPERYEDMIKAVRPCETGVISHGDCWTTNFLYKYENHRPIDVKLIDFQVSRCASPVLDVVFMIYACTTQELRLKYYAELLKYYHDILSKQIREMGSDTISIYSWEVFMLEIKKYSYFGLAFSFESTPCIVLEPEDAMNMDMEGDQKRDIDDIWQLGPYKTKEGRLRAAGCVVHCVDNGYI